MLIALTSRVRWLRQGSLWPCILAVTASLTASLAVLFVAIPMTPFDLDRGYDPVVVSRSVEWLRVGDLRVPVQLMADALAAVMLAVVTTVSLAASIYSVGSLRGDPAYARFFAAVCFLLFGVCMLVLASNFLVLLVFWESLGWCGCVLGGLTFQRSSVAAAARKAFLVGRIGDFGILLGVFKIWVTFGTLNYQGVLGDEGYLQQIAQQHPGRLDVICLLLFAGVIGKSIPFLLHVRLPQSADGPSPGVASIHAVTTLIAGMYLLARCTPLFAHAPTSQVTVAGIGGFAALLAALAALMQNDLRRALAYLTLSQLGLMFLALGCAAAGNHLVFQAVTAATLHLGSCAFVGSLLFLAAGSVMDSMGGASDVRRYGGLRRAMPVTHATFLCGTAALAGVPLLSGFWSQSAILAAVAGAAQADDPYGTYFRVLQVTAIGAALLTSCCGFRVYFLTFRGEPRFSAENDSPPRESSPFLCVPLVILAVFALGFGGIVGPTGLFEDYLEKARGLTSVGPRASMWGPFLWSTATAVIGMVTACLMSRK